MDFEFRVFISYRGKSEGKTFGLNLYNYLMEDPLCNQRYGRIYYSPITLPVGGNFNKDVPNIMRSVEYFIMPLTQGYYEDFWDEERNAPNRKSITYLEINEAIKNNCRFICITFPDFCLNQNTIIKLFGDRADDLLCVAPLQYDGSNTQEVFAAVSAALRKEEKNQRGMAQFLQDLKPNVCLSFKGETEDSGKYPFYEKLHDVRKITLLNFASSSFISGIDIASAYEDSDTLKRWFDSNLINGNIEANIILTNPYSYAAQDAATFKMYPSGLAVDKSQIILKNMNKLFIFIRKYPKARLNVYLTDIALPYGVMLSEHANPANNHIKVDLYAPVISDDKKRPSFYLLQSNADTQAIYSFFEDNIKTIMQNFAFRYKGHPEISWLLSKPIIHRGVIAEGISAHTKEAYDACIAAQYPIEADLLKLTDGTIVVGRADEQIVVDGKVKALSACTRRDLRVFNQNAQKQSVFTLDAFLDYIHNRIPVLFEIKNERKAGDVAFSREDTMVYVQKILEIVQKHDRYVAGQSTNANGIAAHTIAFHSADPFVLQCIKEVNCLIPCGIISTDFSPLQEDVGEQFVTMHAQNRYFDMVEPDFISYNVLCLKDLTMKMLCAQHQIPLLAWTVKDEDTQQQAQDYGCDNIIIEGKKTFLDS